MQARGRGFARLRRRQLGTAPAGREHAHRGQGALDRFGVPQSLQRGRRRARRPGTTPRTHHVSIVTAYRRGGEDPELLAAEGCVTAGRAKASMTASSAAPCTASTSRRPCSSGSARRFERAPSRTSMRSRPSSGAISSRRDAEYARNRTLLPLATGSCLRLIKGRYASQLEGQGGYLGKSTNPGGGLVAGFRMSRCPCRHTISFPVSIARRPRRGRQRKWAGTSSAPGGGGGAARTFGLASGRNLC